MLTAGVLFLVVAVFVLVRICNASAVKPRRRALALPTPEHDTLVKSLSALVLRKQIEKGKTFQITFHDSSFISGYVNDKQLEVTVNVARKAVPRFFNSGGSVLRGTNRWRLQAVRDLMPTLNDAVDELATSDKTRIKDGQISFDSHVDIAVNRDQIARKIDAAIEVLNAMHTLAPRLPEWLGKRSRLADREEAVRCLLAGVRFFPRHRSTRKAVTEALNSDIHALRLVAAMASDDEVLLKYIDALDIAQVDGGQWRRALLRLREKLTPKKYIKQLQRSLVSPHAGLFAFVLDEIKRLQQKPQLDALQQSVPQLTAKLTRRVLDELAVDVHVRRESIAETDDNTSFNANIEALLVVVLKRRDPFPPDAFTSVRTHAAKMLWHIGTIASVSALRALLNDKRSDNKERNAVSETLAHIAKRVGPGGRALVDEKDESGALALSSEGGELALK